jgi:hypothetical protein
MQVLVDNLNVFGKKDEHLDHLWKCVHKCHVNGISFNLEKCTFCVKFGILLGHIVY